MSTDNFKNLFSDYWSKIEALLSGETPGNIFNDINHSFMKKYIDAFNEHMNGGKRLRAFLVILGYNLAGRETDNDIITASLSYEFFQNGILMHDDIIDKSTLRRGRPSMYAALGNNQAGISKAICLGDVGIVAAYDALTLTNFDSSLKLRAVANQSKVFKITIAGELKDIELSYDDEYSLADILTMYEMKTSWYTFTGPLQLGAILGGGNETLLADLENLGRLMGIAFQIKDDITGIYGNVQDAGKSNLSDIEEGKKTVLTSYFRDKASDDEMKEFDSVYGKGNCTQEDNERVRKLFDGSGAHSSAESLLMKYINDSRDSVSRMRISQHHKDIIFGMLDYISR